MIGMAGYGVKKKLFYLYSVLQTILNSVGSSLVLLSMWLQTVLQTE